MLATASLGGTGMEITRVGFGAWALGGGDWSFGWGDQDDVDSIAAIRHAVEAGVNWVDTAAVYGLGHSEEVVARALETFSDADRPLVFTKCSLRWDAANPMEPARRIGAADSLREEVQASLRRLRTERIDLYQMHWPPEDGTPIEDYWGCLMEMKAEGLIRAAGLSNHSAAQVGAAERVGHVDAVQPPLSLINREAAAELIPWCRDNGTGVIVYSPMQTGLLTGAFTPERVASLPGNDWRRGTEEFTGDRLDRNLALAAAQVPVGRRHGVSQAAVAVAWTLAWPGVTGAIVGARRPDQVDDWLVAADLLLEDDDLDELAEAVHATGAGTGPAHPRREEARR